VNLDAIFRQLAAKRLELWEYFTEQPVADFFFFNLCKLRVPSSNPPQELFIPYFSVIYRGDILVITESNRQ
jgi:hypothetical protein